MAIKYNRALHLITSSPEFFAITYKCFKLTNLVVSVKGCHSVFKMASVTNEAEPESIRGEVMQVSNSATNNTSSGNIYISSATSHQSVNANNKEVLKRRIIQNPNPDGKVKKRKAFVKKFRKEWMDEPIFRGWLQPIPNLSEK